MLRPDGVLLATMPTAPTWVRDAGVSLRLLRAVGGDVRYRNGPALRHADRLFQDHGLRIVEDTKQRYEYPFEGAESVRAMAESSYLRTSGPAGLRDAEQVFSRLGRRGGVLPVPIRRIHAVPTVAAGA